MTTNHIIISGTGRAGTTLLVQLFTVLGMETGYEPGKMVINDNARAGLEKAIGPNSPYIIKSPVFCDELDELMRRGQFVVDHAIIPIRDLYQAAESRRVTTQLAGKWWRRRKVPGGLFGTRNPSEQEAVLAIKLYNLMLVLAKNDIPFTLVDFPRFTTDPEYLYHKLRFMFKDISKDEYLLAFHSVCKPALVHDYKAQRKNRPIR